MRVRRGERVLDSGVLRVEFGGNVGFGDGGVVGREVVALEAEGADPDLGSEVHAAEGVQRRQTCLATKRRVWQRGNVGVGTDGGDR